eukprot:TRINITY_DN279_c0_g2_i10.p1 TRINITY_DN279_c0_g2~~TRINITY_DN279_c0_g2_i10.p1  ORF type:complete len:211 (-),score=60.53 TRINITY_DN279_c0_g2_i10:670-1302(-)
MSKDPTAATTTATAATATAATTAATAVTAAGGSISATAPTATTVYSTYARNIKDHQVDGVRSLFVLFDDDMDGFLSAEATVHVFKNLGFEVNQKFLSTAMTPDGISIDSCMKKLTELFESTSKREERAKEIYTLLGCDPRPITERKPGMKNPGSKSPLTVGKLQAWLKEGGTDMPLKMLQDLISEMSEDFDDQVHFEDFVAYIDGNQIRL